MSPVRRWSHAIPVALSVSLASVVACSSPTQSNGGLEELWFVGQPAGFVGSRPAVLANSVVFGSADGAIVARNPASGAQQWTTPVFGIEQVVGSDLISAGGLIVATAPREVAALDAATGNVAWRFTPPIDPSNGFPGFLEASHLAVNGTMLFVPAWGGTVSAVNLTSGALVWSWSLPKLSSDTASTSFRSAAVGVAVSGDTVFASIWHNRNAGGGTRESILVALNRLTGAQLWLLVLPLQTGGTSVMAAPLIAGPTAIVPATDGRVYAVDRATQAIRWSFRSNAFQYSTQSQPAISGDTLFVDGGDEKLYALRVADGAVLWSSKAIGAARDLLVTSQRIYLTDGSRLFVLDKRTGQVVAKWEATQSDAILSAMAVKATQLFVTRHLGAWSFREP